VLDPNACDMTVVLRTVRQPIIGAKYQISVKHTYSMIEASHIVIAIEEPIYG
jgi:hypothetical protein